MRRRGAAGAASIESLGTARTELLELDAGVSVAEAIAELELNPDVAYAEPNYLYEISAVPNDTNFGQLWGLSQASDKDIDAPEAWDLTTGSSSIIVAVIDSGVAYDHPDLAPNIWTNDDDTGDNVDDDGNGQIDDTHGWDFFQGDNVPLDANHHGTHVAGTIGARGNNSVGVTGVNWQVSIMPLRAGDAGGSLPNSAIISSIYYACAERRPRRERQLRRQRRPPAATLTAINSPECANTLFVFAAGNGGSDGVGDNNDSFPQYPCNYDTPRIICVAATDQNDAMSHLLEHRPEQRRPGGARCRDLQLDADVQQPPRRRLRGHADALRHALGRPDRTGRPSALGPGEPRLRGRRNVQPERLAGRQLPPEHRHADHVARLREPDRPPRLLARLLPAPLDVRRATSSGSTRRTRPWARSSTSPPAAGTGSTGTSSSDSRRRWRDYDGAADRCSCASG